MRPFFTVQSVLHETPGSGSGGGGKSEPAQDETDLDMSQLGESEPDGDTGDEDGQDTGDEGDGDGEDGESEDRKPSRRAGARAEEDTEDTESEEDEEEDETESKLGDLEDEDEEETPIGDEEDKDRPSYARPPIKAIKEKYPNFFKEFPQLKSAFFQYPQYAEIFPDIDSAREAVDKAAEFDNLEATLVHNGDAKFLLNTLQENNPKALKRIVGGLASAVREVDSQAYVDLSTPIIEELLYHAAAHGSKIGNKNLTLAARHLANFVFANGGDIPDISKRDNREKGPSEAEVQLNEERAIHAQEKFDTAIDDLVKSINPDVNVILNHKLDGLTSFERKQIIKESRIEIDRILQNDRGFQQQIRNLWKRAAEHNYSNESKSRIKRAWLDRAKLVAPSVRNRLKQEALVAKKAPGARTSKEEGENKPRIKFKVDTQKRSFPERGGKTPSGQGQQRRVLDPKKIDWRKTSDRDILDM
jgi:hypothetical protein